LTPKCSHLTSKKTAKSKQKSRKIEKTKEKPFGPWPSLPSAVLGGREGPEPALGEKKPGLSHFGREQQASKTTKVFAQPARGSRDFFVTYFRNVT
jgi:hypothetical protein